MTISISYSHDDPVGVRWSGLNRPMTAYEIDLDLFNIKTAVDTLQANYTLTVSIASITQPTDSSLLVTLTDSSTQGPFDMPIASLRSRGAWATSTAYLKNDSFTTNGAYYRVLRDHTSDATSFSPTANDGAGHDYYEEMIPPIGNALPTGGATAQVLQKSSGADYAVTWGYKLPTGGTSAQVLRKQSSSNQDAAWDTLSATEILFFPSTASGLTSTNVAAALEEIEANISGGGAALSGLSDVNVTEGSGINGYFLSWNQASGKWVAAASSTNLSGLADVNVTEGSGINGYFLKWDNGTGKWIAAASSATLAGLTDVNVTEGSGINGYSLKWDNGTSKWIASTTSLSGLADVNVTEGSGINGYFLKWDNATSRWVASLTGATVVALSGLTDVNVTEGSGINGYFLKWDNGTSKWIASLGLLASNNLSDVANAETARTNLGLGTAATHPATDFQTADAQLFSNIPQNSKSAAYTTVLTDGQKHIFHPSADTTARTFTIDSNANVAYPIGTAITFVNQHSAGVVTIAITSDTMRLAGTGTTGSRTLAADGIATALKIATTEWIISGTGLT